MTEDGKRLQREADGKVITWYDEWPKSRCLKSYERDLRARAVGLK